MPNSLNFFNFTPTPPLTDYNDIINLGLVPIPSNTNKPLSNYNNTYDWTYKFDNLEAPTNMFGVDIYSVPGEYLMDYISSDKQGLMPQEGYYWLGNSYQVPIDFSGHTYQFVKNPVTGYYSPVTQGGEISRLIDAYNSKWGKYISDNFTGLSLLLLNSWNEYLEKKQLEIRRAKHDYLENMWNTYGPNWNMADMPGDDFFAYLLYGDGDYYLLQRKYPNLTFFRRKDDDTDEANAPVSPRLDLLWDANKVELAQNLQNMVNASLLSSNYSNLINRENPYSVSGQQNIRNMARDATAPYRAVDAALPALFAGSGITGTMGKALTKVANGRLAVGLAVSKAPVAKQIINAGKWGKDMFRAWAPDWLFNTVKTGRNVVGNIAGTAYNNLSPTGFTNRVLGLGLTPTLISAGNALIGTGKTFYDIGNNIYNGETPSFKNAASLASAVGVPGASPVSFGLTVSDNSENPNTENTNAENTFESTYNTGKKVYNNGILIASILAK